MLEVSVIGCAWPCLSLAVLVPWPVCFFFFFCFCLSRRLLSLSPSLFVSLFFSLSLSLLHLSRVQLQHRELISFAAWTN